MGSPSKKRPRKQLQVEPYCHPFPSYVPTTRRQNRNSGGNSYDSNRIEQGGSTATPINVARGITSKIMIILSSPFQNLNNLPTAYVMGHGIWHSSFLHEIICSIIIIV